MTTTTHKHLSNAKIQKAERIAINWETGNGKCYICGKKFAHGLRHMLEREHHCRTCGKVVCGAHSKGEQKIYRYPDILGFSVRQCDNCTEEEKNIIQSVLGNRWKGKTTEKKAIAALRRAMFENCNKGSRQKTRQVCRHRSDTPYHPRLPTKKEVDTAVNYLDDDNSEFAGTVWTVKKHINKKYPRKKKEEEKEIGMFGMTAASRTLGFDREISLRGPKERALSRIELQALLKKKQSSRSR